MTFGKNKKQYKKKGGKRKVVDPFSKKEWYDVRAPTAFPNKLICKTVVNKTAGQKLAADSLRGRVFELNLGDLKANSEEDAFRKFSFRVEEVQGHACLTNFYGMDMTTDKLRSLVRKWQTLIEAHADVKTADGYSLRVFVIAFTKRRMNQTRKTTYAQSNQIKQIRKKMVDVIQKEVSGADLMTVCTKLMTEVIGKEIEKQCHSIFPLQNVYVRKVKPLKMAKTELAKLMEMHGGAAAVAALGQAVARVEEAEPAAPAAAAEDDE